MDDYRKKMLYYVIMWLAIDAIVRSFGIYPQMLSAATV